MPQRWQRRTGRVRCQKNAYGRPSCCGAAILTAEAHANGIGRATESIERANWAEETERQGQPRRARGTGACRAPHRRRAHAQAAAGAGAGGASARPEHAALEARDRALARAVAATVLRRQGELEHVLKRLPRAAAAGRQGPPVADPARRRRPARLPRHARRTRSSISPSRRRGATAARIASPSSSTPCCGASPSAGRSCSPARMACVSTSRTGCGSAGQRPMAPRPRAASPRRACARRRSTSRVKPDADAAAWAERLGGTLLATGSIRLAAHGRIEDLPGYADGAWWVQDAAAALVARIAGDVAGRKTVADLCAAPGGKTATLAAAGAQVTAVDVSAAAARAPARRTSAACSSPPRWWRPTRRRWSPGRTFDVVLLDAPCTATGTIRRHPDILRLKRPEDVAPHGRSCRRRMLAHAATLVASGRARSSTPPARSSPRKASSRSAALPGGASRFRARSPSPPPRSAPSRSGSAPTATCARCRFTWPSRAAGACGHGRLLCGAAAPAVLTVGRQLLIHKSGMRARFGGLARGAAPS